MFIKLDTLTPCTESEIRQAFPNTSFPSVFTPPEGYAVLFAAPQPTYDPISQSVIQGTPVLTDKGHWEQTWIVTELSTEQAQANQLADTQAKLKAFDAALTLHLDTTAQSRRYDNRITCMVRAGFPGPFQAEGVAFATWCDACNALAYELLSEVQSGTRPMPDSPQDLINELPEMIWPV